MELRSISHQERMRPLLMVFLVFGIAPANGQQKHDPLLSQLNSILKNSSHHHWAYEELKMVVDSPFTIRDGVLSMTVRYVSDTVTYRERMEAPLEKVHSVYEDVYVILFFKNNDVRVTGSEWGRPETTVIKTRDLFHVGLPATERTADSLRHVLGHFLGRKQVLPRSEYFREYEVEDNDFREGLKLVELEDNIGYIDTSRMVVIPFQFDEGEEFSEGLAAVSVGRRWGYINKKGEIVIPVQFSEATDFVNGKAEVVYGNKRYSISKTGRRNRLR